MPIYEFSCDRCEKEYEVFQHIKEDHVSNCPDCGIPAKRRFSSFGFNFDFKYGWDAGAGKYFDSSRQRNNFLSEKNLERVG
jgi:putative FmdB family regulatory protein